MNRLVRTLLVGAVALSAMTGTAAASPDPIQHALQIAGAKLCSGGACKVIYPATWMPAARADQEMEMFSGHGTAFTVTNSPSLALAQGLFDGYVQGTHGEAMALMGTYTLLVKQPAQMCYWFTRARHVAHLPTATATAGNWWC